MKRTVRCSALIFHKTVTTVYNHDLRSSKRAKPVCRQAWVAFSATLLPHSFSLITCRSLIWRISKRKLPSPLSFQGSLKSWAVWRERNFFLHATKLIWTLTGLPVLCPHLLPYTASLFSSFVWMSEGHSHSTEKENLGLSYLEFPPEGKSPGVWRPRNRSRVRNVRDGKESAARREN